MKVRALNLWLLAGIASALGVAAPARAYETEVDASISAQYYTLSSPWGDPELRRRRYTETLGLAVWNIQGEDNPRGPRLSFQSRLRLDADFGQSSAERELRFGSPTTGGLVASGRMARPRNAAECRSGILRASHRAGWR